MQWNRIIELLAEAGVTQKQIAEAAQCSQSSISELRTSKAKDPRASLAFALLDLCDAHRIDVREFPKPNTPQHPAHKAPAAIKEIVNA